MFCLHGFETWSLALTKNLDRRKCSVNCVRIRLLSKLWMIVAN